MTPEFIYYVKGTNEYEDRIGLFRVLFGIITEPRVIKCGKSSVEIKEEDEWEKVFPVT